MNKLVIMLAGAASISSANALAASDNTAMSDKIATCALAKLTEANADAVVAGSAPLPLRFVAYLPGVSAVKAGENPAGSRFNKLETAAIHDPNGIFLAPKIEKRQFVGASEYILIGSAPGDMIATFLLQANKQVPGQWIGSVSHWKGSIIDRFFDPRKFDAERAYRGTCSVEEGADLAAKFEVMK